MAGTGSYDLTGGNIRANIRGLALPAATGFFFHTLYNMTDTFYAGFISTQAQSALTFSFPLYFILLSLGIGTGQAVTAHVANAIGKKRLARAAYFFSQGLVLAGGICLFIWLVLIPLTDSLVIALGAQGDARGWAGDYSRIIYAGAPLFLLTFILNSALQATGNTTAFRNSVIATALLNIVLDPLFIFGWFGLPTFGVPGIALATLVAQAIGGGYLLLVFARTVLAARWRHLFLYPRRRILLLLLKQAAAPTGRMLAIGLFFLLVTAFLGRLSDEAVAAYGIALRIEQMFLLPTIGLEVALLAYAGQNISIGQRRQTRSVYYLCLRYGLFCAAGGAALFILFGQFLIGLFNDSPTVITYGYYYLVIAAAGCGPLYLLINLGGAVLMGALRTLDIAIVSALRLLVLPLLFFWLLAQQFDLGVYGIWLGIVFANAPAAWWMHRRCLHILKGLSVQR